MDKLNNISKTYLSRMSLEEMKDYLRTYVRSYCPEKEQMYFGDEEYLDKILSLGMGMNLKKRRKDYIYAKQILESIDLYFAGSYRREDEFRFEPQLTAEILRQFAGSYDSADDNSTWFEKVKKIAADNGFAAEMSDYKAAPENYKGSVSDIAETVRIAITGHRNSPDLWSIMQILGKEESMRRIEETLKELA